MDGQFISRARNRTEGASMEKKPKGPIYCGVCGKPKKLGELRPAALVREPIAKLIRETYPDFSSEGYICIEDLNHFRDEYVKDVLERGKGEISSIEEDVMKSLKEHEVLTRNINDEFDRKLTFGERMADGLAERAGSWRFIIGFMVVLGIWIALNAFIIVRRPFDPYPFILLNLVLSCIAAIQAPVIMMSQKRQEDKDRMRSEYDYRVNLKAELEIRQLHEKIDHLLLTQWQRLLEIQEVQMELLEELGQRKPKNG